MFKTIHTSCSAAVKRQVIPDLWSTKGKRIVSHDERRVKTAKQLFVRWSQWTSATIIVYSILDECAVTDVVVAASHRFGNVVILTDGWIELDIKQLDRVTEFHNSARNFHFTRDVHLVALHPRATQYGFCFRRLEKQLVLQEPPIDVIGTLRDWLNLPGGTILAGFLFQNRYNNSTTCCCLGTREAAGGHDARRRLMGYRTDLQAWVS